jgi:hypothetical protein
MDGRKNIMSEHHHHQPHEGHSSRETKRPLHHNAFFWVAGFFILVALICFVLAGIPSVWQSVHTPPPAPAAAR